MKPERMLKIRQTFHQGASYARKCHFRRPFLFFGQTGSMFLGASMFYQQTVVKPEHIPLEF